MINKTLKSQNPSYKIDWFTTINNIWNLSETLLNDISRSFKNQWRFNDVLNNWIKFSNKNFFIYWEHTFMFEYNSLDELNNDSENWKKRFKKKNTITSETIDWKQILESSWYFEYNWKFYLLWLLYQDLNESDNDENSWIYKWVIVNHEKYFEVENEKKEIVWKINDTL